MTDHTVVARSQTMAAPADRIHPLLIDYHAWTSWSPWEDLDPDLARTYSGPPSGVGSVYEWSGNRKAGAGRMEITAVTPTTVDMDLDFIKPFKSASKVQFGLATQAGLTTVTWRIRLPKTWMTRVFGLLMSFDRSVGGDLERGLFKLKRSVERTP